VNKNWVQLTVCPPSFPDASIFCPIRRLPLRLLPDFARVYDHNSVAQLFESFDSDLNSGGQNGPLECHRDRDGAGESGVVTDGRNNQN
jgi:hypothetical protein